jgi:hypothetical protein
VVEGDQYQVCHRYGKPVYTAPPYPRDIPGVPRERNLKGVSFAVARISAKVAETWSSSIKRNADLSTTLRSVEKHIQERSVELQIPRLRSG